MATDNGSGGSQSLASLRTLIRQEADIENDQHIKNAELNSWINQSRLRLYDQIIVAYGDEYFMDKGIITTDGINNEYPLPPTFYKGYLVEAIGGGNVQPNTPITLHPFNLREKNRYSRPLSILAVPNMFPRYRISGNSLLLTPLPASALVIRIWFAPKLAPLLSDDDVADDWSGWLEYVVVDVCLKIMGKQERDPSLFAARLSKLESDIEAAKANRNVGDPNTVVLTEGEAIGPFGIYGAAVGSGWL